MCVDRARLEAALVLAASRYSASPESMELKAVYVAAYVAFHVLDFSAVPGAAVRIRVIAGVLASLCQHRARYPADIQKQIPAISLVAWDNLGRVVRQANGS